MKLKINPDNTITLSMEEFFPKNENEQIYPDEIFVVEPDGTKYQVDHSDVLPHYQFIIEENDQVREVSLAYNDVTYFRREDKEIHTFLDSERKYIIYYFYNTDELVGEVTQRTD